MYVSWYRWVAYRLAEGLGDCCWRLRSVCFFIGFRSAFSLETTTTTKTTTTVILLAVDSSNQQLTQCNNHPHTTHAQQQATRTASPTEAWLPMEARKALLWGRVRGMARRWRRRRYRVRVWQRLAAGALLPPRPRFRKARTSLRCREMISSPR